MNSPCPERTELFQFAMGNLSSSTLERVSAHVQSCSRCENVLEAFDEAADPLLARLRAADGGADSAPLSSLLLRAARAGCARLEASPAAGETPQRLGKFALLEELGAGSFGAVFRARDTELDRTVAIKILRAGKLAGRDEVDRFLREARSAAQLEHPGIVSLYDIGQTEDGTCYLVQEFVQGTTLAGWQRPAPWDFRRIAELVARVADALDYAHQQGVVHRDVKPSNIMVDPEGRPHLMDFGLAKRDAEETLMTLDGQLLGTPAYMSPEQARGEAHQVDARSDLFSLGVILYELLTGERPFRGNRRMLLVQVLQDEPRAPRRLNDKVPRDLETICQKAMAKAPARRYGTARELAADLRRWLNGEPIRARPVGHAERLWRWCRRNPVPTGLLLALSLGSGFGLVHLSRLAEELMRKSALEGAALQSEMLEQFNNFYSDQVVDRVDPRKVWVSHDYKKRPGAIPLPATLTHDLGAVLSKSESGMQVRLYSDFPFRWRTDGGPHDDFERDALQRLRQKPDEPVYRFEEVQGRPSLRYAIARRMTETCVRCHNGNPESIKRDWKEGDVRGVVEIIRPLDRDVARARAGLRGTFILMASISGSLLALAAAVIVVASRRRAALAERSVSG